MYVAEHWPWTCLTVFHINYDRLKRFAMKYYFREWQASLPVLRETSWKQSVLPLDPLIFQIQRLNHFGFGLLSHSSPQPSEGLPEASSPLCYCTKQTHLLISLLLCPCFLQSRCWLGTCPDFLWWTWDSFNHGTWRSFSPKGQVTPLVGSNRRFSRLCQHRSFVYNYIRLSYTSHS